MYIQTIVCLDDSSRYSRNFYDNSWSSWKRDDNYGTSSLSELASALGASILPPSSDINEVFSPGIYTLGDYQQHSPYTYGALIVYRRNNEVIQMAFPTENINPICFRSYLDGEWLDWRAITDNMPTFYKSYSDLSSLASALKPYLDVKVISVSTWSTEEEYIDKGGFTPAPYQQVGYGGSIMLSDGLCGIELALFKNDSLYGIRIRGLWDNTQTPWVDIKQIV